MKKMLRSAIAILAGLSFVSGAQAADVYRSSKDAPTVFASETAPAIWSGIYIGAQVGYGTSTVNLEDDQGGIALSGLVGGLRVGGDLQRDSIVFGVFADYNFSDEALELGGTRILEKTDDWSINARLGYAHGPTLFYVAGGYGQANFDISSFLGGGDATVDVWNARAGIEHKLSSAFTLGLEGRHDWYDLDSIDGLEGAEDELDAGRWSVMAVGKVTFNSDLSDF